MRNSGLCLQRIAGGGAVYWFKLRKKPDTKGPADLDNYDYGEDEDEEKHEIEDNANDGGEENTEK